MSEIVVCSRTNGCSDRECKYKLGKESKCASIYTPKVVCNANVNCHLMDCTHKHLHKHIPSCDVACSLNGRPGYCKPEKTVTVVRYVNLEEFRENIGGVCSFRTSDKRSKLFNHKITMTVETRKVCSTCGIEIKEGMI